MRETGGHAVRAVPPDERKTFHPIPIVRRDSSPGGSSQARLAPAACKPPPIIGHLPSDPQSLPPMHEGFVKISTAHRVLMARAVVAEMDQGLVIAPRGLHLDGVCSVGFASCLALMLSNSKGVGLVHTSGLKSHEEEIQEAQEEISLRTGLPARLRIGYNLASFREELWQEAQRSSAAAFARDYQCTPAAAGADELTEKTRVIDIVLARHRQHAELLAKNYGADCILMPHSFMALSTDGTLHLFEGLGTGVQFRPVK